MGPRSGADSCVEVTCPSGVAPPKERCHIMRMRYHLHAKVLGGNAAAALLAAALLPVEQAPAQAPRSPQVEWVVEREVSDRWLHGSQLPRFTPFRSSREWLFVDSVRTDGVGKHIFLTLRRMGTRRDSGLIVADARGRISRVHVGLAPYEYTGSPSPDDSARWAERQRLGIDGRFSLPETRVWDLVPTFPTGTPAAGRRWTDTVALRSADGRFLQSLDGIRISWIAGDTIVDGRRFWMVHDSARVRYREQYLERERTLDTTVQISRTGTGIVGGAHLYDAQLGLFRERFDTTNLIGNAVLQYSDGREFRTPARYARTRRWVLYDPAAYTTRTTALSEAARRERGGMVYVPSGELERRLASGDAGARDSLIAVWRRAADPDSASRIFSLLGLWVTRGNPAMREMLDSMRVAAGDTAHLYQLLARRAYPARPPMDTTDVRAMLRFMANPAIAWSLNVSRDWLYENLVQGLTTWPRAVAVGRDSAAVTCTIAACNLLGDQWRTATEPRLRDVGLVALVSIEPRRWSDTVLALAGPRRPLLTPAAQLVRGVGATWPAALKAPMPAPHSDFRLWLEWMDGRDPAYVAAYAASASRSGRTLGAATPQARFDESHVTAIRFYEARTGREIVEELQRGYATATSDSARLVFGTMLQRLGELKLTDAEIADAFASGDPARTTLARATLVSEFRRAATALPGDSAAPFIDRMIAVTLEPGATFWRSIETGQTAAGGGRPSLHVSSGRIFLNGTGLPDAVRAKWGAKFSVIVPAEWSSRDPREGGVFYSFARVVRWGRFVRVSVSVSERGDTAADAAPRQYASWNAYYLMELDGEWVVIAREGWIT